VDSSRSHDPRLYRAGQPSSTYPYENGQQPPKRTSPSVFPYEPQGSATYPYEQQVPHQPVQQQPPQPRYAPPPQRNRTARRLLGVLAFLVLTGLSLPLHIGAIFFIYVEFESPGDPAMAALLISAAFLGSFAALFVTGLISQLVGGFPGRWRARTTFATLSGIIALGVAYFAALNLF
jgi:predicted lipid-binding transport protein (Tim44 family)